MSWCLNCRAEYVEGVNICSDCDCELVEILVPVKKDEVTYSKEELLLTVTDSIEANLIKVILNDNNIPVIMKHKGSGAYLELYMGMTYLGIEIYVPSKLLNEAKEILDTHSNSKFENDSKQNEERDYLVVSSKKRRINTWIVLLFFIPGIEIVWIIVGLIVAILSNFKNY